MEITIRELRKKLGLTQEGFALKLGVAPMTVRRWEAGKTHPLPMARKLIDEIAKEADTK